MTVHYKAPASAVPGLHTVMFALNVASQFQLRSSVEIESVEFSQLLQ